MTTAEQNKLITESPFCPDWVRSNIDHHTDSGNDMALNDYMESLRFHSEWRWIMETVANIRLKLQDNTLYDGEGKRMWEIIVIALSTVEILAVNAAVTQFILWYNKNNL